MHQTCSYALNSKNIIDFMNAPCETFYNKPVFSASVQCIMVYRISYVKNVKFIHKTGLISL